MKRELWDRLVATTLTVLLLISMATVGDLFAVSAADEENEAIAYYEISDTNSVSRIPNSDRSSAVFLPKLIEQLGATDAIVTREGTQLSNNQIGNIRPNDVVTVSGIDYTIADYNNFNNFDYLYKQSVIRGTQWDGFGYDVNSNTDDTITDGDDATYVRYNTWGRGIDGHFFAVPISDTPQKISRVKMVAHRSKDIYMQFGLYYGIETLAQLNDRIIENKAIGTSATDMPIWQSPALGSLTEAEYKSNGVLFMPNYDGKGAGKPKLAVKVSLSKPIDATNLKWGVLKGSNTSGYQAFHSFNAFYDAPIAILEGGDFVVDDGANETATGSIGYIGNETIVAEDLLNNLKAEYVTDAVIEQYQQEYQDDALRFYKYGTEFPGNLTAHVQPTWDYKLYTDAGKTAQVQPGAEIPDGAVLTVYGYPDDASPSGYLAEKNYVIQYSEEEPPVLYANLTGDPYTGCTLTVEAETSDPETYTLDYTWKYATAEEGPYTEIVSEKSESYLTKETDDGVWFQVDVRPIDKVSGIAGWPVSTEAMYVSGNLAAFAESTTTSGDAAPAFDEDDATAWTFTTDQTITIALDQSRKVNQIRLSGTGLDQIAAYTISLKLADGDTQPVYTGDTTVLFEAEEHLSEEFIEGVLTETAAFDSREADTVIIAIQKHDQQMPISLNNIAVNYNPWPETRLRYAPPVMDDPEVIYLTSENCNSWMARIGNLTERDTPVEGRDFILVPTESFDTQGGVDVYMDGARHTVLEAAEIFIPAATETASGRRAIRIQQNSGKLYIEGLWVHGENLAETFNVVQPTVGSSFVLQNLHVDNMTGTREEREIGYKDVNHPDIIQNYGGPTYMYVDRLTGQTDYQGYMIQPLVTGNNHTKIYKNSNLNMVRSATNGYQVFLTDGGTDLFDISDNIWLDDRYGVNSMALYTDGNIKWPNMPWDRLNGGLAPNDFSVADENGGVGIAGLNYVSPGYAFWEELPIKWTRQDYMDYKDQNPVTGENWESSVERDHAIQAAKIERRKQLIKVSSGEETKINAVDGRHETYWAIENTDAQPFMRIDLQKPQDTRQITIQQREQDEAVVTSFVIEMTNDAAAFADTATATGSSWTTVYSGTADLRNGLDILPEQFVESLRNQPATGRYWQIRITGKEAGAVQIEKFRVTEDAASKYVTSDVYKIDNTTNAIANVPSGVSVGEFLRNLRYRGVVTILDDNNQPVAATEPMLSSYTIAVQPLPDEAENHHVFLSEDETTTLQWFPNAAACEMDVTAFTGNIPDGQSRQVQLLLAAYDENENMISCSVGAPLALPLAETNDLLGNLKAHGTLALPNGPSTNIQIRVYLWDMDRMEPMKTTTVFDGIEDDFQTKAMYCLTGTP